MKTKSEAKHEIKAMVAASKGEYLGPFDYTIEVANGVGPSMGIYFDPDTDEFTYFDHTAMSERAGNKVSI